MSEPTIHEGLPEGWTFTTTPAFIDMDDLVRYEVRDDQGLLVMSCVRRRPEERGDSA